jgi:hypothetical protein
MILVIPWVTSKLPLTGWVYPTGFAVRKTPRYGPGGLQPEAKASFVVASDGTRLIVRLGPRRWVTVAGVMELAYLVLFLEGLILLCRYQGNPRCSGPSALAMPFVLPAMLAGFLLCGVRRFRDEAASLVTVLKQTLEAEEVT